MATELVLYIQEDITNSNSFVEADLYRDEKVSLTMTIQNVKDVEKVRTDFSQPFTLPASSKNNKLFTHWYNPDIVGFNANYRHPAKLELNHLPFKTGFIELNSVAMKDNQPNFYKITFYGQTVDLKNVISEDQISQLTWLNNQGFVFINNNANAKQGLNNGLNKSEPDGTVWQNAFIYPLLGHSVAFNYESNPPPLPYVNFFNLWSNFNQTHEGVFYNDLKPAIRVDLILRGIEEQYNLKFSNDFFFTSATENLYLWMSRNKGPIVGGGSVTLSNFHNDWYSNCSGTGGEQTNDGCLFFNPGGTWNGVAYPTYLPTDLSSCEQESRQYINKTYVVYGMRSEIDFGYMNQFTGIDASMYRSAGIGFEITPVSGYEDVPYSYTLRDTFNDVVLISASNVTGVQNPEYYVATQPGTPTFAPNIVGPNFRATWEITITCQDAFNFNVLMMNMCFTPDIFFYDDVPFEGCVSQVRTFQFFRRYVANAQQPLAVEVSIVPTEQLPEIKTLDFLTGLFKTYNLTAYFDDGEIKVQPLNEFYDQGRGTLAGTSAWDLTKYVHSDSHNVAEALPFSEIVFQFSDPVTIIAQKFEQLNNRKYGEIRYRAESSRRGIYKVDSPFEHMLYERIDDISTGDFTSIQQGTFLDDNLNPAFGKPLLFYGVYNNGANNEQINWVNGVRPADVNEQPSDGTRTPFKNYWMISNANELGTVTTAPEISLNYGSELNTYWFTDYGGDNNSLFQKYWQRYIVRVMSDQNRLFKFSVKLPEFFLLNFKMNDVIQISNRQYTINSITADLTTGESTMELLNIV